MAGTSNPWKVVVPSPTASNVWLSCVIERSGYLWVKLIVGGSTLGGGAGGSLGGKCGGTSGGTIFGVWGSALPCSAGRGVVAQVRLGGSLGAVVVVPFAAKMVANCQMAAIVWEPK